MQHTPLDIIFEDPFLCVLNKPSGIHSVNLSAEDKAEPSIASLLIQYDPAFEIASLKPQDGGLINRLDFETSGAIIAAKDRATWNFLFEEQRNQRINKTYLALVDGEICDKISIETWIYSRYRSSQKVSVEPANNRQPERSQLATTEFFPLKFLPNKRLTLVRALAHAARRHQIRAHAAYLGHPLIGDELYGSTRNLKDVISLKQTNPGFALHAHTLSFRHPDNLETYNFEAPANPELYQLT
jgi:23S rRNA pseudouridine1911/1915/1917 synthase